MLEHYSNEELRVAVGVLLAYIDKGLPEGFHYRGQTEDWFVAAAMMASNIPPNSSLELSTLDYLKQALA